ncbi:hypothetical protein IT400_04300 [Candidatus Nomurabacteria bacterium]|nr:hypothetical protein [Candidatus Nomurabacteria bacterium]
MENIYKNDLALINEGLRLKKINLVAQIENKMIIFSELPEKVIPKENISPLWEEINNFVKNFFGPQYYVGLQNFSKFELRVRTN